MSFTEKDAENYEEALGGLPLEELKKERNAFMKARKEAMHLMNMAAKAHDTIVARQAKETIDELMIRLKIIEMVARRRIAFDKRLRELKKAA